VFIEDGLQYDYRLGAKFQYAWGWLGDEVPIDKQGWDDANLKQTVIARLLEIMNTTEEFKEDGKIYHRDKYRVHKLKGWHDCEICERLSEVYDDNIYWNGCICIKHQGREFRAPWAAVHYINRHDYNPGSEVIDALFHGKLVTYDEVDGEQLREMHRRARRAGQKLAEERRKREEAKPPELKAYECWAAHKVQQLQNSDAMVNLNKE